jgi:hypothetical protein
VLNGVKLYPHATTTFQLAKSQHKKYCLSGKRDMIGIGIGLLSASTLFNRAQMGQKTELGNY